MRYDSFAFKRDHEVREMFEGILVRAPSSPSAWWRFGAGPERLAKTDATRAVPEIVGGGPFRYVAIERVVSARNVNHQARGGLVAILTFS